MNATTLSTAFVACFTMEIALEASMPTYAGGLAGVAALPIISTEPSPAVETPILEEASDLAQPDHNDIHVCIRDAFQAARRRLEDYARLMRGDTKHRAREEAI